MSLQFNIAIDGHSSCGKSTIAKSIAYKYNMRYVDTGAMYRAVTLYFMRNKVIENRNVNQTKLLQLISDMKIDYRFNTKNNQAETILNGENVENIIRGMEVSENVSVVSQIKPVREKLILIQKDMGKYKNVVMDGRDIGTKVFGNAKLKLFITASSEIRAKRRYDELVNNGDLVTFDEILKNINFRDNHDENRSINPLVMANDAVLIDNSNLSIREQNLIIERLINKIMFDENNN